MPRTRNKNSQAGTSLIEVALTVLILVIVMGAVFSQIDNVTKSAKHESIAVDLVQQNRDFVDLFVRDIHMTGYPHTMMYGSDQSQSCTGSSIVPTPTLPQCALNVSAGIVSVSPTVLVLEGDVYGDGNVYSVSYKYYPQGSDPNDPNCPCLRRSAMLKVQGDPIGGQPTPKYYTEVQNVIDPTGMTQGIFTYFDANGNPISVGTGVDFENNGATIQTIDAIKVNLNVRSVQLDLNTGSPVVYSLASIAELEN